MQPGKILNWTSQFFTRKVSKSKRRIRNSMYNEEKYIFPDFILFPIVYFLHCNLDPSTPCLSLNSVSIISCILILFFPILFPLFLSFPSSLFFCLCPPSLLCCVHPSFHIFVFLMIFLPSSLVSFLLSSLFFFPLSFLVATSILCQALHQYAPSYNLFPSFFFNLISFVSLLSFPPLVFSTIHLYLLSIQSEL